MDDKITNITREDNPDSSVSKWHVVYTVYDSGAMNQFVIVIDASSMVDEMSETEAKTLANSLAALKKSEWIISKTSTPVIGSITNLDETVSL